MDPEVVIGYMKDALLDVIDEIDLLSIYDSFREMKPKSNKRKLGSVSV